MPRRDRIDATDAMPRCPRCGGTGLIRHAETPIVCPACRGVGRARPAPAADPLDDARNRALLDPPSD